MSPEHARTFAGGASETSLNPVVLVALILAIVLILILPRKYVIWPAFFLIFLVPVGEQVFVGGIHLYSFRLIIIVGLFRVLFAKFADQMSAFSGGVNTIDRVFIWCTICQAVAVSLLFLSGNAVVNQLGNFLDVFGGYLLMRFLIRDQDDIYRAIKCFAILASILGACMLVERVTLHNIFTSIGGQATADIRDGVMRSQGPFAHELMAGAFGATLMPLFVLLWKKTGAKFAAAIGLVGSVLMTWTSNSSTSLLAFVAGAVAIAMWPIRKSMRTLRWGMVAGLVALQLVMKAPIWFLIARIDLTGGSSSYHRAELIDVFIRHFSQWFLIGVKDTGTWGWDMWDAQNQFVNVGESGGLISLILFIALISICFGRLGDSRKLVEADPSREWFIWLLGAALFSNVVAFFGVNYFDQTKFVWFALLVMISAAVTPILQTSESSRKIAALAYNTRRPVSYPAPTPLNSTVSRVGPSTSAQLNGKTS